MKNDVEPSWSRRGISGGLMLQLKLCGVAALVFSAPYWIYQIWAFILPGLHPGERKWSRVVAAIAGPLFFLGVALGYYVLPKGIQVLIDFVPQDMTSLVDFGAYFSFVTRMLLIFGVAMEIPFFVILLNLAGVVSGKTLGRYRPWIWIGVFVFAAVATPSTDPFSMLMLAIPLRDSLHPRRDRRPHRRPRPRARRRPHRPVGRRRDLTDLMTPS